MLHAIAACLTAGIANVAAARGRRAAQGHARPSRATSTCSAFSGCPTVRVRNGYQQIRVTFHIEGDADDATLRGIVEQSRRRSAVYDVLTNPTPVIIDVVTG